MQIDFKTLKKAALNLMIVMTAVGMAGIASASAGASFSKGRTRLSLTAGYASVDDHNYTVIGGGVGYFFADGFEAGLDGEAWVGSGPGIYSVAPETRYIFTKFEKLKPYIGGFYKRTFYDDYPSADSIGARTGVIVPVSGNAYISGGAVFEEVFDCDERLYTNCTQVYPEFVISVAF